jgi:signal transduction histidine kinase
MTEFRAENQVKALPSHPPTLLKTEAAIFQRLEALSNAILAISTVSDLNAVLQSIADNARQFGNSAYAALGIVNEQGVITAFITSGISQQDREKIGEPPTGHGLLGVLIKQGKPLRVKDMSKDARKSGFPPHHPPMTSLLGVPVSVQGRIVGDLYLTDKIGADEFSEAEEWWLTLFARQAAVAVEKARLAQYKEEFLSMIAHDLRAPLTAIKMSAGLLEASLPHDLPPALIRLASNLKRNSERMSGMLEDLLELTRLEQGQVQLKWERLEMGEVAAAMVASLLPVFEEKQQTLLYERPSQEHWLRADRHRLEQVLVNLLINAHKYTPSGGKVHLKLEQAVENLLISIIDTGKGIPPEEQPRIFNRFYRRLVDEQNMETSGSGLGLPIARQLIELHGGKLWVESVVGEGSTFFIKLPL